MVNVASVLGSIGVPRKWKPAVDSYDPDKGRGATRNRKHAKVGGVPVRSRDVTAQRLSHVHNRRSTPTYD